MTQIMLINCAKRLENIINYRNNHRIPDYDIIIFINAPIIKLNSWKKILGKFKEKYNLTTKDESDHTNLIILINRNIKTQRNWLETSLNIDNNQHKLIIKSFTDQNTKKELCTMIDKLKPIDMNNVIMIGIANSIKYSRLSSRDIDTIIQLKHLHTTEDLNRIKKAYTIIKEMEKVGLTNTLKTTDETWQDTELDIMCFIGKETRLNLTVGKSEISMRTGWKDNVIKQEQIPKLKLDKIGAELFYDLNEISKTLCRNWSGQTTLLINERMNKLANELYNKLNTVQNKVTERKNKRNRSNNRNTMSPSITQLLETLRNLDKRINETNTKIGNRNMDETLTNDQMRREIIANKIIDELNKEEFDKRLNDISSHMDNIWDRVHQAEWIIESIETNTPILIDNEEQLNKLLESKFPIRARRMQETIEEMTHLRSSKRKQTNRETNNNCLININEQEIERAMYELRNKTYAGIEGIKFKIFTESYKYVKELIHTICKMSFHIGLTPNNCRTTLGNLIPKKAANQFRIVHVSTPLASLLEQIALHRLEFRLEANNLYSPRQYGFAALRDRHDLIIRVLNMIKEHEYKDKYGLTTLIGLDINGAFDNVDQDTIITQLIETMPQDNISIWLANFILYRYIKVQYNGHESKPRQIYMGVPQGSALGPILWNFTINSIDNELRRNNELEILAYADDLILVHKSSIFNHETTQKTIDKLTSKLENIKLDIRAEKCSTIIIRNSKATLDNQQERIEHNMLPLDIRNMIEKAENNHTEFCIKGVPIITNDHINILGVQITDQCKLKANNDLSNDKTITAASKLKAYREIGVPRSAQDWKILINSHIKSRTLINNYPILAIDQEACTKTDKLMIELYTQILNWPNDKRITNAIRFITELYPTFEYVKQTILNKAAHEHSIEAKQFIYAMNENTRQHNLVTTSEEIDLRWNRDDNVITNNQTNTRLTEYNYSRRRYHDPSRQLTITKSNHQNIKQLVESRICWLIHSNKQGCIITKYAGSSIQKELCITHKGYTIGFFNEMATLWYITSDNITDHDKTIVIDENSALILALRNSQNHDWRVIELRERLAQQTWQFITIKDGSRIRSLREEHAKKYRNRNLQTVKIEYDQPYIQDYVNRYKSEQAKKKEFRKNMDSICPPIIKALEGSIPIEAWQKLNFTAYNRDELLALNGYIKAHQTDTWIKDFMQQETTHYTGCSCIRARTTDIRYTTIHRLTNCKKYRQTSIRLKEQLKLEKEHYERDKINLKREHKDNPNRIAKELEKLDSKSLINKTTMHLKAIVKCAKSETDDV